MISKAGGAWKDENYMLSLTTGFGFAVSVSRGRAVCLYGMRIERSLEKYRNSESMGRGPSENEWMRHKVACMVGGCKRMQPWWKSV